MNTWVTLRSAELTAQIDPLGAQLSVLRDSAGRDLLWNGDPAVWSGRAPLLFPIVGALTGGRYRLGTDVFHLPRHGFARGKRFRIEHATAAAVRFRLLPDEGTRAIYPFEFDLSVDFELAGSMLSITATAQNCGVDAMPASIGFHPGFRWPLPYGQPRPAHVIEFDNAEPLPVRRLDAAGLLTPELHATPVHDRRLSLDDALFHDDVIIFDRLVSRSLRYGAAAGPKLQVAFADAPYLGLWTKPGAPFICIEPWHGVADPVGFGGDFSNKPGIRMLPAGTALSTTLSVTLIV